MKLAEKILQCIKNKIICISMYLQFDKTSLKCFTDIINIEKCSSILEARKIFQCDIHAANNCFLRGMFGTSG